MGKNKEVKGRMVRTVEFLKRSEARIIIYLLHVPHWRKHGGFISDALHIDYIYTMKILKDMFDKGWVTLHRFDGRRFFNVTLRTPTAEAKKKIAKGNRQTLLKVAAFNNG